MRLKSSVLLALALGCGLVASIGISQVLDSQEKTVVETVPIYVALANINLGDPVDDTVVALQEWPRDKVPAGAISKWEDIEDRRPRAVIFEGEPILEGKLLGKGQSSDPIRAIPPDMRLKTVSVDARKSAAGLLSPGDRVDVQLYVDRNPKQGIEYPMTRIILQNVRVFAVDQSVMRSGDDAESRTIAKTVSLIVTPQQANKITTAENLGEISLIPRNPEDERIVGDAEQTADDLFGRSESNSRSKEQGSGDADGLSAAIADAVAVEVPEADPPFRMRIIYPNEVEELEFSSDTGELISDPDEHRYNGESSSSGRGGNKSGGDKDASSDDLEQLQDELSEKDFPIDLGE